MPLTGKLAAANRRKGQHFVRRLSKTVIPMLYKDQQIKFIVGTFGG
jgi:hypothetical protein